MNTVLNYVNLVHRQVLVKYNIDFNKCIKKIIKVKHALNQTEIKQYFKLINGAPTCTVNKTASDATNWTPDSLTHLN